MTRLALLVAALAVVLCVPALGEDLRSAEGSVTEQIPAIYQSDEEGNMDWVREYDGRKFNHFFGTDLFNNYGYAGPLQWSVLTRDLTLGNEDVDLDYFYKNVYGFSFLTSALTHRLPRTPAINPYLAGTTAAGGDDFLDLSPGEKFFIDRRVNDFLFRTTPTESRNVRLVASLWQEIENGQEQFLFRAREAQPGVIANRQRGGVALPVNRDTNEGAFGGDFAVGSNSVLNYRFVSTDFDDERNFAQPGTDLDFLPLNSLTKVSSDTRSHVFKGRSKLSDKLHFTGVYINKNRRNTSATLAAPEVDIDSTNLALTYFATDSLSVTGRYRRLDMDNLVASLGDNQALSKNVRSAEVSAAYIGIPRLYLQLGYERRDTDRSVNPIHPPHEEFEHPLTALSTDANIVRARLRYYPTLRFSVSGSFENYNADDSGYNGTANDNRRTSLNATYLITDNFAVYGDYSKWHEKNDDIRVAIGDIPTLREIPEEGMTPEQMAEYQEIRQSAAGQGYDSDNTVATIGAWYAVSSKLVLDVNYSKVEQDTSNLWILGITPGHQQGDTFIWDIPHLFPNVVAFKSDNTQWSIGATYALAPRWRIFGRFFNSSADGQSILDPSFYPEGIPSSWTPFDIDEKRYTIGFAHELNSRDTLQVDFSLSDWDDNIDPSQDGKFQLWRFAWGRKF